MALNKTQLDVGIKTLVDGLYANTSNMNPQQARDAFSSQLANLIDQFVKSGTVNVTVSVTTTGTATAHTGGGTGTGNIT